MARIVIRRLVLALLTGALGCGDSASGAEGDAATDAGGGGSGGGSGDGGRLDAGGHDRADAGTDASGAPCGNGTRDDGEVCDTAIDLCCASDCMGVAEAGSACRTAAGACDIVETCNGTDPTCPEDDFMGAKQECRAVNGDCDVAEKCTGDAAECPDDAFLGKSVECRAADDVCDAAEHCSGKGAACPDDDDAAEDTSCDDGVFCNGEDVCDGDGACTHPGDPCATEPECADVCNETTDTCDPELEQSACSIGKCDSGECCPDGTQAVAGGCGLGGGKRIVFVTSQAVAGDLLGADGIDDGDTLCNQLADAANLAGTFSAWLSDNKDNAKDRIGDGPFHLIGGTEIAKDGADLIDGVISAAIDETETGAAATGLSVWTATVAGGTLLGAHCAAWSTADSGTDARFGCTNSSNGAWTNCGAAACDATYRIYCFEDDCPGFPLVNFDDDPMHCGVCGNVCGSGTCATGVCSP